MFQWLKTQPKQLSIFSVYIAAAAKIQQASLKKTISTLFPSSKNSTVGGETSEQSIKFLLVDVGAGHGQAPWEVQRDRPDLDVQIIAQDLPEVIAGRPTLQGVENMCHDFFSAQPIKGGYIFYCIALAFGAQYLFWSTL